VYHFYVDRILGGKGRPQPESHVATLRDRVSNSSGVIGGSNQLGSPTALKSWSPPSCNTCTTRPVPPTHQESLKHSVISARSHLRAASIVARRMTRAVLGPPHHVRPLCAQEHHGVEVIYQLKESNESARKEIGNILKKFEVPVCYARHSTHETGSVRRLVRAVWDIPACSRMTVSIHTLMGRGKVDRGGIALCR